MAEQNQDMQAVIAQALQGAMTQMKQMQAVPAAAPAGPAVSPAPGFAPALTGWSVPVEQEINGMTVTLHLNFPPETFAQAQNIIMTLANQGFQVRAFQKNNGGFGGGFGGGYSRGGFGGGYGGGYSRGGFGRRW